MRAIVRCAGLDWLKTTQSYLVKFGRYRFKPPYAGSASVARIEMFVHINAVGRKTHWRSVSTDPYVVRLARAKLRRERAELT